MKILVFEYITGGGFNKQNLPESLANEGRLMLQALLDSLSAVQDIAITVMLDPRMAALVNLYQFDSVMVTPAVDCQQMLQSLIERHDAVWPLAPEFGGVLLALCQAVERQKKILLTSPSSAVAVTGNKFLTYQRLVECGIDTVPSRLLNESKFCFYPGENIVKPVDGIGCEDCYLISDTADREQLAEKIHGKGQFIVQPHVQGKHTSMSCLFKQGEAWPLCANLQKVKVINKQYRLSEIVVNHCADLGPYRNLAARLAKAFPDLWGYAGIDLIEMPGRISVLEINPRLTTSAAGIEDALGISLASLVLQLLKGNPALNPTTNRPISLPLTTACHECE